MIIDSVEYKGKNVTLDTVHFQKNNVLVGASGAGKTTIINSIQRIIDISNGESFAGASWKLSLRDDDGHIAIWEGQFSKKEIFLDEVDDDSKKAYRVERESLTYKGKEIFKRSEGSSQFLENKLPESSPNISLMSNYKSDQNVHAIQSAISKIRIITTSDTDTTDSEAIPVINTTLQKLVKEFYNENPKAKIRELSEAYNVESRALLYFAKKYDKESFEDVEFEFTNIFPFIRKISLRNHTYITDKNESREYFFIELITDTGKVIQQGDISSGMFKTLNILSTIYLSASKSTILIDEVENSLGVNCLPDILNELYSANQQVIFSSHHPKIINKSPTMSWLVVTRQDQNVMVHKASELGIDKGNHDPFTKLINHHIYNDGVNS